MNWKKLGCVYDVQDTDKYTHAMFPNPLILNEDKGLVRIFYTHRDKDNYGFPTYLDLKINKEEIEILYNHNEPILEHSEIGCFDECGVNITSIIQTENETRYYYLGWSTAVKVPFRNAIGVLRGCANKNMPFLERVFKGPILDRTTEQPYFCATPGVIKEENFYRMYYTIAEKWQFKDNIPTVACYLSYADSTDGLKWNPSNKMIMPHKETDHVLTTPFVIKEDGIYKLWYSYRGEKYRIGYAESTDGKNFERKDEDAGITVSKEGWDSEMVEYPVIFNLKDYRYMLYCGSDFGRSGFGIAILSK